MDEADWLACKKLHLMLAFLKSKPGSRKLRLFACACCRRLWPRLKGIRRAVLAAEQFVDRLVSAKELAAFESSVTGSGYPAQAVKNACGPTARFLYSGAYLTSLHARMAMAKGPGKQDSGYKREEAFQVKLLRDVVGNPFRPVPIDASWLTRTVVSLAKEASEKRHLPGGELELERLAVLADALEDAGCTSAAVLGHLRGPGTHVRGCHVLDLLLARS